jgi:hypothetical protein
MIQPIGICIITDHSFFYTDWQVHIDKWGPGEYLRDYNKTYIKQLDVCNVFTMASAVCV